MVDKNMQHLVERQTDAMENVGLYLRQINSLMVKMVEQIENIRDQVIAVERRVTNLERSRE